MQRAPGLHPRRRPVGRDSRRPRGQSATATWQLVCPQGIVGGVDARASEAAVAVEFPGRIGSPVNPGITTTRNRCSSRAPTRDARARPRATSPFIGCIPGGGGGPRTPIAFTRASAVKPGEPITLRVDELRVTPGQLARTTLACQPGRAPARAAPTASASTRTARRPPRSSPPSASCACAAGGTILVSATRRGLAAGVRAVVQVQAECAR